MSVKICWMCANVFNIFACCRALNDVSGESDHHDTMRLHCNDCAIVLDGSYAKH
jgi:hypothetical protein